MQSFVQHAIVVKYDCPELGWCRWKGSKVCVARHADCPSDMMLIVHNVIRNTSSTTVAASTGYL